MLKRNRFKQTISFKDRLASFARETRDRASLLPPGTEKDDLLMKARQADMASHFGRLGQLTGLAAAEIRTPRSRVYCEAGFFSIKEAMADRTTQIAADSAWSTYAASQRGR